MINTEPHQSFDSTSAAGSMMVRTTRMAVLRGFTLVGFNTSTSPLVGADVALDFAGVPEHTTAGFPIAVVHAAGAALGELRRLSGFTWDQLARLFKVSRRSLHFWASGKPMLPGNHEHLQRLLSVLRKLDRGSAAENRALLLGIREDGTLPFDLLAAGAYDRVLALLGTGTARRSVASKLSDGARAARAPRPPEELVDARNDRIHPTSGRLLAAKAIAVPRGK